MFGRITSLALVVSVTTLAGANAQEWTTFTSTDDGFTIDLPGTPKVETAKPEGTVLSNRQYQLQVKDGGLVVGAARYSADAKLDKWTDDSLVMLANGMKGDCQVRDGKAVTAPAGRAYEFVLDQCKDGTVMKVRLLQTGDRLYQLIAAGPPSVATRAETARFHDSFKLTAAAPTPAAPAPAATPAAAAPPAAPAAPAGKLTGPAAWNALVGNTVSGKFDGELQIEHYLPDGRVKMKYDDNQKSGTWTLRNEKICVTVKGEDEECWGVEVDGNTATFIESSGKRLRYDILKGNPSNL